MSFFDQRQIQDSEGATLQSISGAAASLLRTLEGERLEPYRDAAGVLTIGCGHTGEFPRALQEKYALPSVVTSGLMITQECSEELLAFDVARFEATVREHVTVPLKQNEFDALVLLAFNIGASAFAASTLVKLLNRDRRHEAADEFLKWRISGGKVLEALEKRRAVERHIFLHAAYDHSPYDGDLSDAVVSVQDRAPVDRPSTEGRPDLRGSRTIDASRKGIIASIMAMLLAFKEIFGEDVFTSIPTWAIGAGIAAAISYAAYQHFRAQRARVDDYLARGR